MHAVVASIEARMGSSRLPGKVLMDVCGKPVLSRLLDRLRRCKFLDGIVLATTVNSKDDVLEQWADKEDIACYRGDEEDVLQRVVGAHAMMGSEVIVEVTGDCPLLDPGIIDLGIETFMANECDVVTNTRYPSYPQGCDVQVFRTGDLVRVSKEIHDKAVREHVSLHFYEAKEKYRVFHLVAPSHQRFPKLRLQLDYIEDLFLVRKIYQELESKYGLFFRLDHVVDLLRDKPELAKINAHCDEKPIR